MKVPDEPPETPVIVTAVLLPEFVKPLTPMASVTNGAVPTKPE